MHSPALQALKPALFFLSIIMLVSVSGGGETGSALLQILGLPWVYFFQYLPLSEIKMFLTFEGGAWFNVVVVYFVSFWWYSRKHTRHTDSR